MPNGATLSSDIERISSTFPRRLGVQGLCAIFKAAFWQNLSRSENSDMNSVRIALANLRLPATREESVALVEGAIMQASTELVDIICFPECFVPGYRGMGNHVSPPDPVFLERAWASIAAAAGKANAAIVLGTERLVDSNLVITALVINRDGTLAGFQDKVQIDPSEEGTYSPGSERRLFQTGAVKFGVAICLEGWRYPETVRWAARRGAQIVFHPHYHKAERTAMCPQLSLIQRTAFTRRQCCVAPRKTPAGLPARTAPAPARRPLRQSSGLTVLC